MRRIVWGLAGLLVLAGCSGGSSNSGGASGTASPPAVETSQAAPAQTPAEPTAPGDSGNASADSPAPSASELTPGGGNSSPVVQAMELVQVGELDKAVELLRGAVAKDPKDRGVSLLLIQVMQGQAMQRYQTGDQENAEKAFSESAAAAEKFASEMAPLEANEKDALSTVMYNGACVDAKAGKLEEAQKRLVAAFDLGFSDLAQLDKDEDLTSLRDRPEYQEFRAGVEKKIAEAARNEATEQLAKFESFPFDFELTDVDGKPRKLADYKGKVVIVDIWGTWCPPCRMEIPHFVELHKKYQEKGLEIVGINYEDGEAEEVKTLIKKFMTENGMTYTCVIGDDATRDRVPNFEGFPTTLFIDRAGKVRLKEVGYRPLVALEAVVSSLLAEEAPATE